jgi:predicted flap endonuclease-1-like 5' DNA nuclease
VSVIVISMVLVVVGFVTLMLGVLGVGDDPLQFVYVSIAACLVAAVFLVIGVVRGRPSKKPVAASGGGDASWSGASSWGSKDEGGDATGAITREDAAPAEPVQRGGVQVITAEQAAGEARNRASDQAFAPPAGSRAEVDADDEEVAVVPKRSAASAAPADDDHDVDVDDAVEVVPASRAKRTPAAKKATARKAASKKSTARKATAKKAASKKSTAGKATAKKAASKRTTAAADAEETATPTAKRSTAKKTAAKKTAAKKTTAKKATASKATAKKASAKKVTARAAKAGGDDAARAEEALSGVSGVGPAKRRDLLAHFGSFEALSAATPKELEEVDGISETLAERIRRALR